MRTCLHCPHEGPDDTFAFYKDAKGTRRPRNICIRCERKHAADRQARYKEKHGDRVRETARNRKYDRYHSDPEFRQKCIDEATKRKRHERSKTSHSS
jgi:hypothetical protein